MKTRAILAGDHYLINGPKRLITEAGVADFAQVMAVTDPEKRARGGITCFLVDMDTPGVALCKQNSLPVIVLILEEQGAVARAILGEPVGTLVS